MKWTTTKRGKNLFVCPTQDDKVPAHLLPDASPRARKNENPCGSPPSCLVILTRPAESLKEEGEKEVERFYHLCYFICPLGLRAEAWGRVTGRSEWAWKWRCPVNLSFAVLLKGERNVFVYLVSFYVYEYLWEGFYIWTFYTCCVWREGRNKTDEFVHIFICFYVNSYFTHVYISLN